MHESMLGFPGSPVSTDIMIQVLADPTRPRRRPRAVREPLAGGLRQLFGRAPGTAYAARFLGLVLLRGAAQ
jgi:hypothetical protein